MVEKNKILILGANGMLGHELMAAFKGQDLIGWDSKKLDITDYKRGQNKIKKLKPDIIINAAAYTAVDDCEYNRVLAMKVNSEGPSNLARICHEIGAVFVHYSTDYIFNGQESSGYNEDETQIEPINFYGESKALGEKLVQQNCQKFYILRTAWLYGKNGKNFVDTMIKLGRSKPELKVVDDQHGNPTSAKDLAERTKEILLKIKPDFGIYHVTNSGVCTWYEFSKEIFKFKKIEIKIIPCRTSEFPRPAKRPSYSILNNTKLPPMRSWQDALHEYLLY